MKATVYIPDEYAELYEEARKKLPASIGQIFIECLKRALENHRTAAGRIVVDIQEEKTGRVTRKAFDGVWLVGGRSAGEVHFFEDRIGATIHIYSVACTKKGVIVVIEFNRYGQAVEFQDYFGFEDFSTQSTEAGSYYPESLVSAVSQKLGLEPLVEVLDI